MKTQLQISFLLLILSSLIKPELAQSYAISKASNFQTNVLVLHNTASTAMLSQLFSHTFTTPFNSTPFFAFGSSYQKSVQFITQNFDSYEDGKSSTTFYIRVIIGSSTPVYKFSINFIAYDGLSYITTLFHVISGTNNISSGTGARSQTTTYSISVSSLTATASPFLTSYYFTSSTKFYLVLSANVTSLTTCQFSVSVDSDTRVNRVKFYVLVVDKDGLSQLNYFVEPTNTIQLRFLKNTVSFTYGIYLVEYTNVIIGVSGFQGDSATTDYQWGWSQTTTNSNSTTITLEKLNFISIYYSMLQIGVYSVVSSEQVSSGSSIFVIIGVVVAVLAVGAAVIFLIVWYRRRKGPLIWGSTEMITTVKELPDFSF